MRILLKITKYFFIISIALMIFLFFGIYYISRRLDYTMPKIINIEIYDNNENIIQKVNNINKTNFVSINEMSPNVINAFLSIEDKEFYEHKGINVKRIVGAFINDLKDKDFSQGGSTITQQYVKNVYLENEKTITRKINEALISINLELKYSKDEILEGYLNSIYFDHGIYGIEDASQFYFNKHAKDLTINEAAVLASIPKSPTNYSPIKNKENNFKRKNLVLSEMLEDKKINECVYQELINEFPELYGEFNEKKMENAPYYFDSVIKELNNLDLIYNEDIKIYTSLNLELTNMIQNSIKKFYPSNSNLQIAIIAIDYKGDIISELGGLNYSESSFNRATSAARQPGSTIKPMLYYAALDSGFNVANTFNSTKTTFNVNGTQYTPKNYNDIYAEQDISMAYAIAVSDNIYAIKTHLFLGTDVLQEYARNFGIKSHISDNVSAALGTSEVSLLEITTAYSKLAALGKDVTPSYITKVTDKNGNLIFEKNYNYKQKFNSDLCFILSESMNGIFDYNMRYNISPTGTSIAAKLSNKYAAKTGSTDYDNWMIGYNNKITLGIWIGYDDNSMLENKNTRFMKYIWADIMEEYNKNFNNTWYEVPENVIGIKLNPLNGKIAVGNEYSKYLYFKTNNLPNYIYINKNE